MKKRKLKRVQLSKQFLIDLLAPFTQINEIVDVFVINDKVVIDYRKEGGVNSTP
jgi:hypothetical protein